MNRHRTSATRSRCMAALAIASLLLLTSAATTARPPAIAADPLAQAPADGLTKQFDGEIASIQGDVLMIVNAVGEDYRLRVAEDATIMLNDTEASFDALTAGLHATVMAESRGSDWFATSIDARRQY